jgi:ubiquitin C-terminal hydrolase
MGWGVHTAGASGVTEGLTSHDANTGTGYLGDEGKLQDIIEFCRELHGPIPTPSLVLQINDDLRAMGASRGSEAIRNVRVRNLIDIGLGAPMMLPNPLERGEELTGRLLKAKDEVLASDAKRGESKVQDDVQKNRGDVRSVGDWSENGAQMFFWGSRYRTHRISSRNMSSMSVKRTAILRAWGNVGAFDDLYRLTREPSFNYIRASLKHSLQNFGVSNLLLAVSPVNAALRLYVGARADGVKWAVRYVEKIKVEQADVAEKLVESLSKSGRRFVVELVQTNDNSEGHYSVLLCRGKRVQAVDVLRGSVADKVGAVFRQLGFEVAFEYLGWTWIHRYDARRTVHAPERMGDRGACSYIAAFVALEYALAGKSLDDLRSYVKGPHDKRDAHRQMSILGRIIAHFIGMDVALRYDALPSEVDHIRSMQRTQDPPVPGPPVPKMPAFLAREDRGVVRRAEPPKEIPRPADGWSRNARTWRGDRAKSASPRRPLAEPVGVTIGADRSEVPVISGSVADQGTESPVLDVGIDPRENGGGRPVLLPGTVMHDATDVEFSGPGGAGEAAARAMGHLEGSHAHQAQGSGSNTVHTGSPSGKSDGSDHPVPGAAIQPESSRVTGVNPGETRDASPADGTRNGESSAISPGSGGARAPSHSLPYDPKHFLLLGNDELPHQKMFAVVLNSLLRIDGLVDLVRTEDVQPSSNFESAIGTLKHAVGEIAAHRKLSIKYVHRTETNFWVNGAESYAVSNLVNVINECSKASPNRSNWVDLYSSCIVGKARCVHCEHKWEIQKRSVTHLTVRRGRTKRDAGNSVYKLQDFINNVRDGNFTLFDTECDACMVKNCADVEWSFKRTPRALLVDLDNYSFTRYRAKEYKFKNKYDTDRGIHHPGGWYWVNQSVRHQFGAPDTLSLPTESGAEVSYALKSIICIYEGNLLWCSVEGGERMYNRTVAMVVNVVDLVAVYECADARAVTEAECVVITDDYNSTYKDTDVEIPTAVRRGLKRSGTNACFVNAAIQCMITLPAIQRMARTLSSNDKYDEYKKRIEKSISTWNPEAKTFRDIPTEYRLAVMADLLLWSNTDTNLFASPFLHHPIFTGEQQDSASFLFVYLLMNDEMDSRVRRNPIINSLTTYKRSFNVTCSQCTVEYEHDNDSGTTLPIHLQQGAASLQELIDASQDDDTMCTTCGYMQKGPVVVKFTHTPKVIIISLNRFPDGHKNPKVNTKITSNDTITLKRKESVVDYTLYSVICHSGNTYGHYVAYVKSDREWFKIDDDDINPGIIDDKESYMFFYEQSVV